MNMDSTFHKNILIKILKDIYSDSTIAPFLGFKGGTALYLFYDLERFSTDLDFDLIDDSKEEYVFVKISEIVKKYGQVKDARRKRFSLFFLVSYSETSHNLKVEVNLRKFGSRYEIKTYFGISMLVMRLEDMFANKIVAMYERVGKTNRDIYDVWFFLKNNWSINTKIVEERTNIPFADFLSNCIVLLDKMNDRHILSGIGELLDENQKSFVKTKMRNDTIFLLRLMLDDEK